ncbi:MAG: DUF1573 domain-containing protein [Bacteroidales bacterium]|nr:DUF1573 domain-containing protein [Bacteroidales bacterium]
MKKFFLTCLVAAMTFFAANAQTTETATTPENGAKIKFITTEHDYGTITKGANGDCVFEFVNEGNEPLVLSRVRASCGCTTPSYTDKPVMPGQKGEIKVHYNTNSVGGFSKTITVNSNAVNTDAVVLRIRGKVEGAPAQSPAQPQQIVTPQQPEPIKK